MGRINSMIDESTSVNQYSPSELIKHKFMELKDNPMSKYFFLYFLHLMDLLDYQETSGQCIYSRGETIFEVPLPVIDSREKYLELESLHKNLEKFFNFLKKQNVDSEVMDFNLLEDI